MRSLGKVNLVDTVSADVVWLSDQKRRGSMLTRTPSPVGRMSAATRSLLAMATVVWLCAAGTAQSTSGRILGTLTDQSGAAVAGASVVITDVQRGTSRTVKTDESGNYAVPDLQPGSYKIHVEAKGFK